jgi:alpha-D-ribose 1-methylphosphonate 5-triphosphate diphosphatase
MKCKSRSMVIGNASIVTPTGVRKNAWIKVKDGIIAEVSEGPLDGCGGRIIDASGMYVLPGFIDLHSDAIEKEIEPRTGASFPVNMAIFEMDKKLAACGITTMYHSISYSSNKPGGMRNNEVSSGIIREVNRLAPKLGVRTKVHARFDITNSKAVPFIEKLLAEGNIHLLSVTDHTPGQGQYRDLITYAKNSLVMRELDETAKADHIERRIKAAVPLQTEYIWRIVSLCQAHRIPVASHDDDTLDKLDLIYSKGINISEFPITMEVAESAAKRGMHILLGAPNVVRGTSTSNNLNARDAIKAGYGDILCSDYSPLSMIHAVYTIEKMGIPLHIAANMASLNPARAAGISVYTGSIETGKSADLIIVDSGDEVPRILKTFVEGKEVYSTRRSSEAYRMRVPGAVAEKARLP